MTFENAGARRLDPARNGEISRGVRSRTKSGLQGNARFEQRREGAAESRGSKLVAYPADHGDRQQDALPTCAAGRGIEEHDRETSQQSGRDRQPGSVLREHMRPCENHARARGKLLAELMQQHGELRDDDGPDDRYRCETGQQQHRRIGECLTKPGSPLRLGLELLCSVRERTRQVSASLAGLDDADGDRGDSTIEPGEGIGEAPTFCDRPARLVERGTKLPVRLGPHAGECRVDRHPRVEKSRETPEDDRELG